MNYPVWELYTAGGGFLIALIAVVHVYVAHFAVGGGLFLVLTEHKAYRTDSAGMLAYVKQHTRFFMLVTMVFGGVTGVGIWFTIALLNPGATSTLIHTFVFGWATEWVCFTGEIVALFVYFYTFGKMKQGPHLQIGWLYFIFAWLSLFLVNGIIDFMLTPGQWLDTGSFWAGFFNPTMLPSLAFRTAIALMFAGVFGFITSMFIQEKDLRESMIRYCCLWVLIPFAAMLASGLWYFHALPQPVKTMILKRSPELMTYVKLFFTGSAVLFVGGILLALKSPLPMKKCLAFLVLAMGLVFMGGFEFLREGGRKPWVIYNHTYANAITKTDQDRINSDGFLASARWVSQREITPKNQLAAGKEIFLIQCTPCHSMGGPMKDILVRTQKFSVFGMDSMLDGLGKINDYMPPFMGTRKEREALASYIVSDLQMKPEEPAATARPQIGTASIPEFNPKTDQYVLLAWNNLGMHCISDSDPYWVLLPPANDLFAQLIRRGPLPELVTEAVSIRYQVEPGFETPSRHVDFWKNVKSNFGKDLEPDTGLSGSRLSGEMHMNKELKAFEANLIPVVPYPDNGTYNPYPLFSIEAIDTQSGKRLALTKTVAPTATEMGCKNCHGGEWRVNGQAGFTDATSRDVLLAHDKNSGTRLLEMAEKGQPRLCQSCHPDPVLGTKGTPGLLNFPAAIHGWHANYLTGRGTEACYKCHPSAPEGPTRCLRGVHADTLDCTSCHGFLEDHALSLLKQEDLDGKPGAKRLMAHLKPRKVPTIDAINPRTPWVNEPDCLTCHKDFTRPDPATADGFNTWTKGINGLYRMRHDDSEVMMCEACHGSPHAIYPAKNVLDPDRDSIQPLQYQGNRRAMGFQRCSVCHTVEMEDTLHHPMQEVILRENQPGA
ncbi:MAG: cytochrome ubiquinol oxidase subunit I [Pseudomonadota bacterium]